MTGLPFCWPYWEANNSLASNGGLGPNGAPQTTGCETQVGGLCPLEQPGLPIRPEGIDRLVLPPTEDLAPMGLPEPLAVRHRWEACVPRNSQGCRCVPKGSIGL